MEDQSNQDNLKQEDLNQEDLNQEDPNQDDPASETAAPSSDGINKRFRIPLRIIIVIIAVVFAVLAVFGYMARPYDKTHTTFTNVTVEQGDDVKDVSEKLEEAGIIADAGRFRLVSRLSRNTSFKPGLYYLSPSMDSVTIAKTMAKGLTTSTGFTIPDGYTLEQIATALERDGFADKEKFLRIAESDIFGDIDFIGKDIKGKDQLEGFLLPGEYTVNPGVDETMLIVMMLDSFSNFFNDDYRARADELGMDVRDVIIIASVIEQETSIDKEKGHISAVIHNRINMEMDQDLPKVPLCSPGKASITAALYPEENEDLYYVLSDKLDGSHVFTDDKEEYEQLLKAYNDAAAAREQERDQQEKQEEQEAGE